MCKFLMTYVLEEDFNVLRLQKLNFENHFEAPLFTCHFYSLDLKNFALNNAGVLSVKNFKSKCSKNSHSAPTSYCDIMIRIGCILWKYLLTGTFREVFINKLTD